MMEKSSKKGYKPPGEPKDGREEVPKEGVYYQIYRKPLSMPSWILNRSAMGENTKVSTASAKLRRR